MPTFRDRQTTEDAFVNGNVVNVTAQVGGVVTALAADNTDCVTAGSLVRLDDVDAWLALARATAQLAKTVRQARIQDNRSDWTTATDRCFGSHFGVEMKESERLIADQFGLNWLAAH